MTSPQHPVTRKKYRGPASTRKMNTLRHQLVQIIKGAEDSALRTPAALVVIATYLNRLNFIDSVNQKVRWDPTQWKYSPGVLAQLLVLAAFIPANKKTALRRIHLAYAGMDLELLVGEPIDPAGLSDELFAAMLDRLHEAGCEEFFSSLAFTVRTIFDLPPDYTLHSDTTSHVLYGDYESTESTADPSLVHATYGLSKQKRKDLKQIMTGMVTDGDGLIRICHVLDGNTADTEYNHLMLKTLQAVYGDEFHRYFYIADSKLLTKKNLAVISDAAKPVKIISRVPESFNNKQAERTRKQAYTDQDWHYLGICCEHPAGKGAEPEYWVQTYYRDVFDIPVWVHIYKSGDAEHKLQEKLNNEREVFEVELKELTGKQFACEPDAFTALNAFRKSHTKSFFDVNLSCAATVKDQNPVGRPSRNPKPQIRTVTWSVSAGELFQKEFRIEQQRQKDESFILLTNVDLATAGSREVLLKYKGQQKVEHNFSILKEPLLASTLFLEKPERIEAMMTLLYFSVLMHGILQVISRARIATSEEPPRIGPENRPLIRPRSDTMLNILALFEFVSNGDEVSIRSKVPDRRAQLELIFYLVDFDPTAL